MLPVLEGIITRRVLLNFRAAPEVVSPLVPEPLEVLTHRGAAIVGVCLIRLERLRPQGLPEIVGLASENMAHRVAIRYPTAHGMKDGVFIWRRDTDVALVTFLGGRLFPGVHHCAKFYVAQDADSLEMEVHTAKSEADVWFGARCATAWKATPAFFEDRTRFPSGSVQFDSALLMRGIPHEWHELNEVPELAGRGEAGRPPGIDAVVVMG